MMVLSSIRYATWRARVEGQVVVLCGAIMSARGEGRVAGDGFGCDCEPESKGESLVMVAVWFSSVTRLYHRLGYTRPT